MVDNDNMRFVIVKITKITNSQIIAVQEEARRKINKKTIKLAPN